MLCGIQFLLKQWILVICILFISQRLHVELKVEIKRIKTEWCWWSTSGLCEANKKDRCFTGTLLPVGWNMVEYHVVSRPTYGVVFPKEHSRELKPVYFANCSYSLTLWVCVWKCKLQSVWWVSICTTCSLWNFWKFCTIILRRPFFFWDQECVLCILFPPLKLLCFVSEQNRAIQMR